MSITETIPINMNIKGLAYSLISLLLLHGCASIPEDLGRSDVNELAHERGMPVGDHDEGSEKQLIESLLSTSLTAEDAIRIALVKNPRLKATYAELGFAAADVYEASRIRNPIFSAAFLDSNQSGERDQITYGFVASFTDLITLPTRKRLAKKEYAIMKQAIGAQVLEVAIDTELAFYEYVAAKQIATLRSQIAKAAQLSFELAQRYYNAGNLTPRDLALEHAAASEARLTAIEEEANTYRARTALASLMGLSNAEAWDSPPQLPVPLEREDDIDHLLKLALQSRLDLAAANARTEVLADRYGFTNWSRWIGDLNVGYERERETDGAKLRGPTLDWEVPVFNQRRDSLLRANANFIIALNEVDRLTMEVQNQVRLAYAATENAKSRVNEYREQLIPARIEAVERAQEEENFMIIGIFELLQTKQQEYDAYQGYLEVVRDYWLSRAELARAVGTTLPSSTQVGDEYLNVDKYVQPKSSDPHAVHNTMSSPLNQQKSDDNMITPSDETDAHHAH